MFGIYNREVEWCTVEKYIVERYIVDKYIGDRYTQGRVRAMSPSRDRIEARSARVFCRDAWRWENARIVHMMG